MPKYYVETGRVRLVISAQNATEAAVKAFQWTCDRQSEIYADSPLDHCRRADEEGCQVDDEIRVNELGFGSDSGVTFDTFDIVAVWQGYAFAWGV